MAKPAREAQVLRDLGKCIREARASADLTQEAAAARAGMGYKRYQAVEQGKVNVTVRTLSRIAQALDLDFWDLVRR